MLSGRSSHLRLAHDLSIGNSGVGVTCMQSGQVANIVVAFGGLVGAANPPFLRDLISTRAGSTGFGAVCYSAPTICTESSGC